MYLFDTFTNFLSGMGIAGRDKLVSSQYVTRIWTRQQLEASFRSDWIARKAISIPAYDATREWRAWQAEADQIEKLEKTEKRIQLQLKLQQALTKARLYGGCCIMIGVEGNMEAELDPETIKKDGLKFIHVLAPHQLTIEELVKDIDSPYYGQPEFYVLQDDSKKNGSITAGQVKIHPSRMVRLIGNDTPDPMTQHGWGDPLLQQIHDAVNAAGTVTGSVATLISEAKFDVIKIPGLTEIFSTEAGTSRLIKRFTEANVAKSVINGVVMDAEEEWQRIGVNFQGMPEILQMYLQIAAGAADIPVTRFLGMSPAGLNATGESDLSNYYDRIASDQELRLTPALEKLDKAIMRSALGKYDEDIFYEWNSLWQMDDTQKATIAKQKAETAKIDADSGLVPFEALVHGRVNQLIEDGTYPGLEAAVEDAIENQELINEDDIVRPKPANENEPGDEGEGGMDGDLDEEDDEKVPPKRRAVGDKKPFDEDLHPRGQPENKGQFGPGGGGSTAKSKGKGKGKAKTRGGKKEEEEQPRRPLSKSGATATEVLAAARARKVEGTGNLVKRARESGRSVAEQHEHEIAKGMKSAPKAEARRQEERELATQYAYAPAHWTREERAAWERGTAELAREQESTRERQATTLSEEERGTYMRGLLARAREQRRSLPEQERHETAEGLTAQFEEEARAPVGTGELSTGEKVEAEAQRVAAAQAAKPQKTKKPAAKADFEKAGIKLSSDMQSEKETIAAWNEKIGIEPEAFKKTFLGGQNATMRVTMQGKTFDIQGNILDENGHSIGEYNRELSPDKKDAYSAYFKIKKSETKGDIGKKILAGNVEMYEALGIDMVRVTANIDVGGYAWAKYGYVPEPAAWNELRQSLDYNLAGRNGGRGQRTPSSDTETMEADEWSMLGDDQQAAVQREWMRESHSEFVDSEIESWRDSGRPLEQAKKDVADAFNNGDADWAMEAIAEVRAERLAAGDKDIPYTDDQIFEALTASEYESRYEDGRDDVEFEWNDDKLDKPKGLDPDQKTLPGIEPIEPHTYLTEDMRTSITDRLTKAAETKAESDAGDKDPPSYIDDQVEEYQEEYWESMDDTTRLQHAERYGLNTIEIERDPDDEDYEPPEEKEEEKELDLGADPETAQINKVREYLASSNPKNIWKVADTPLGKELLLKTNWKGRLNLKDPESYARFKAYVAKRK